ncbi:MAG TPA: squalene--hopene cyclase [Lentisphaeria bacterium]|nr:squalene--hopene cyclase [Lentisphaeria bacterium]
MAISVINLISAPALYGQKLFIGNMESIPPELENMYAKGLVYLQKTQNQEGDFQGQYGNDPGVVGLCIVAMLAKGDDPNNGPYSSNIKRGINKIIKSTNSQNGYIGNSMYSHGFATLALAESYGVVNDDRIGPALKKAVELIISSQNRNPRGAWRYGPESKDADTTVSGAISVALFASANAGIPIPDEVVKKALKFYETCQGGDGGFGYTGRDSSNYPRTAIGALVFALAKKKDSNTFKGAMSYLQSHNANESGGHYYHYGLYYASQSFFHTGTESWDQWNEVNIKSLKIMQTESGSWNGQQGPAFSTAAALLSMALNFRYLPIYER